MTCIHKNPSLIPSVIICNQTSWVGTYVLHVSGREEVDGVYSCYYTYLIRQGKSDDQNCKWNKKLFFKDLSFQAFLTFLKIKYKSSRRKHSGIKSNFTGGMTLLNMTQSMEARNESLLRWTTWKFNAYMTTTPKTKSKTNEKWKKKICASHIAKGYFF